MNSALQTQITRFTQEPQPRRLRRRGVGEIGAAEFRQFDEDQFQPFDDLRRVADVDDLVMVVPALFFRLVNVVEQSQSHDRQQ